jgi:hypothetical protein
MTQSWSIGGLIAHCFLFWSGYVIDSFKKMRKGSQEDRHWVVCFLLIINRCLFVTVSDEKVMQKYKEAPWWWFGILLVLSFVAGETYFHLFKIKFPLFSPFSGLIVVLTGS